MIYRFIEWSVRIPLLYRIVRSLLSAELRFIVDMKPHSMLHWETLLCLYRLASTISTDQFILEIGAYKGGATVIMALARPAGQSIAIEVGGAKKHFALPSNNIISDLRRFLKAKEVSDRVYVVEGWSNDPQVSLAVSDFLAAHKIGLLLIDADGNVGRDFEVYRGHLSDGALIVCDDYHAEPSAQIKVDTVKPWIDNKIATGELEEIAVKPWGTWFGRYRGQNRPA